MDIEQLVLDEESLSKEILGKVKKLIDLNSKINRKCKLEPNLRQLSLHSNSKLRSLVGFCRIVDRKRNLRILLSKIKEMEEEEAEREKRKEKEVGRKKQ